MADRNRRFTVAAIALPFLFLVMSGLARATTITVNSTSGLGGFFSSPVCTLPDAVTAANTGSPVAGCPGGSGDDTIVIGLTGTIFLQTPPLSISDKVLSITTFGDGQVVIDGGGIQGSDGGIMFVSSSSKFLELTNLTFADGLAEFGGALFSESGGDVDIKDCLFVDNTVENSGGDAEGGAIFQDTGRMEITNSTFYHNLALKFADTFGGAIFDDGGLLKLTNVTFEHNYAGEGSAIFNSDETVDVKGTIFADHLEKAGTGVVSPVGNCAGTATTPVTDENYNISVDSSCKFTAGSSLNNVTSAEIDLDPLGLQNNGGPSFTVAILGGSDALNRIPVAACTDQSDHGGTPLLTDQRLFNRPDPANLNFCDSGAFELDAVGPYTLNNQRVEIARGATANTDQVNMGLTFTSNGDPDCDFDEDALNFGIGIGLFEGTCASLPFNGLVLELAPFDVHSVNHQEYGTLFQSEPDFSLQQPNETVSARMVALAPPAGTCGKWTLNLEVAGLDTSDTSTVNLPDGNPFALLIFDGSDAESCFDLTNPTVQVGNQIDPPKRSARRGARR